MSLNGTKVVLFSRLFRSLETSKCASVRSLSAAVNNRGKTHATCKNCGCRSLCKEKYKNPLIVERTMSNFAGKGKNYIFRQVSYFIIVSAAYMYQ